MPLDKADLAALYFIDKAKDSLLAYAHLVWPLIEPGRPFIPGWHINAICEHLEAVEKGEIKNLLVNIPPGHMKSLLICVLFPSWSWIRKPEKRFLTASYAQTLSTRDAVKSRDIIRSERYHKLFRPNWSLKDDQDQKTRYSNTSTGYRIATSVGGSGTGERADCIICDDPINAIDASSQLARENASHWWWQTMSTRDADPRTTSRIVVMQRLHEMDLSGEIAQRGGYEHLCLPAEFESKSRSVTCIGWQDPRKEQGELLWPQQYGHIQLAKAKKDLGSRGYSGQFQQDPIPLEGGLFKRNWWQFYDALPMQIESTIQFWDCAQKVGITNDYSVCTTWAKTNVGFYLIDMFRGKLEAPQLKQTAINLYYRDKPNAVVIEDKSSGSSLIQQLKQETTIPVFGYNPGQRDKQVRASAATPQVEAGNCYLPSNKEWTETFIEEHEKFPNGEHDDAVDCTSMMIDYFTSKKTNNPRVRSL